MGVFRGFCVWTGVVLYVQMVVHPGGGLLDTPPSEWWSGWAEVEWSLLVPAAFIMMPFWGLRNRRD